MNLGPLRRGLRRARYHRRRGGLRVRLERRLDHGRVVCVLHSVREGEKRSDRSWHIGCWRVDTESMAGKSRTCYLSVDATRLQCLSSQAHARDLFLRQRSQAALTRVGNGVCTLMRGDRWVEAGVRRLGRKQTPSLPILSQAGSASQKLGGSCFYILQRYLRTFT